MIFSAAVNLFHRELPAGVRQNATGWLRIVLRSGLALGLLGQIIVLVDLDRTIYLFAHRSGEGIIGWGALALGACVLSALSWGAALVWGRSNRAVIASGVACLLSWSYYLVSYGWSYFAAEQHALLYLLPLFPFLFVATGVVMRDVAVALKPYVADAMAAAVAGSRAAMESAPRSAHRFDEARWFVPTVYGITASVLLFHRPWFLFSRTIAFALLWALRGRPWTHNFSWLLISSGLGLILAAILRHKSPGWSGRLGLSASVLGCVYGVIALQKLYLVGEMDRDHALQFGTKVPGEFLDWVLLSASFLPVCLSLALAARDATWDESIREVLLRGGACLCFTVFAISGPGVRSGPDIFGFFMFYFALAYLFAALYPVSLYDFALGASWCQIVLVLWFFEISLRGGHFLEAESLELAGANVFLLLATLMSSLARGKPLRPFRIAAGFLCALGFAALLFWQLVLTRGLFS